MSPEAGVQQTISIHGTAGDSEECQQLRAEASLSSISGWGARLRCQRCPHLLTQQDYVLALVANNGPDAQPGSLSELVLRPVRTADVAPPRYTTPPYISQLSRDFFEVSFALDEPGTVHFAVSYSRMTALYDTAFLLQYTMPALSVSEVLLAAAQDDSEWRANGIVSAGSVQVPEAGTLVSVGVRPACVGSVCSLPGNVNQTLLSPDTQYLVSLLAEDVLGNRQTDVATAQAEAGGAASLAGGAASQVGACHSVPDPCHSDLICARRLFQAHCSQACVEVRTPMQCRTRQCTSLQCRNTHGACRAGLHD